MPSSISVIIYECHRQVLSSSTVKPLYLPHLNLLRRVPLLLFPQLPGLWTSQRKSYFSWPWIFTYLETLPSPRDTVNGALTVLLSVLNFLYAENSFRAITLKHLFGYYFMIMNLRYDHYERSKITVRLVLWNHDSAIGLVIFTLWNSKWWK